VLSSCRWKLLSAGRWPALRLQVGRLQPITGVVVASLLTGSWREAVEAWSGAPEELAAIAPLLLRGGVAGLAWRRLRSTALASLPAAAELQQAHRLQVLRASVHEDDVARAFARLQAAGIEPVLGKGWAAARLYPDAGLRPYGDVDLYVRPAAFDRAREVLLAPDWPAAPVDLHRGFAELDDHAAKDLEARCRRDEVHGTSVRTFGDEDHLRLLCLHGLRHGLVRPLWLCDVAAGIERRAPSFDWERFGWGDAVRTRWAMAAVGLAHLVLGARLDGVPFAEAARGLPPWLVSAVEREWRGGRTPQGARLPMAAALRQPSLWFSALWQRWPNPIEATVGVGGAFGHWPRFPYQVAECVRRTARFVSGTG
jgi:hypothetical protein